MATAQPLSVAQLCSAMEAIAPTWAAADWDNVGLLVGDPTWPAEYVLLTIDLTAAVLDEAVKLGCNSIVSYHPPIFRAVKRFGVSRGTAEGLAAEALSRRIAIYSPHTALDAAPGGTNDTLAELAGLTKVRPFSAAAPPAAQCKLVVFVPHESADEVAEAVFAAGAGRIGAYERCSYRLEGQGTFFGTDSTNPAVGERGRLERVDETRLEVILPKTRLATVVEALRAAHPYEEPAFDVYPLEPLAIPHLGQGRMGSFSSPPALGDLARAVKQAASAEQVAIVGEPGVSIARGFVCAGAAGSLPFEIPGVRLGHGDVVITGEIRHHDALHYRRCGACAIALGHWASERPVLIPLSLKLKQHLPGASITMSKADADPFASA